MRTWTSSSDSPARKQMLDALQKSDENSIQFVSVLNVCILYYSAGGDKRQRRNWAAADPRAIALTWGLRVLQLAREKMQRFCCEVQMEAMQFNFDFSELIDCIGWTVDCFSCSGVDPSAVARAQLNFLPWANIQPISEIHFGISTALLYNRRKWFYYEFLLLWLTVHTVF